MITLYFADLMVKQNGIYEKMGSTSCIREITTREFSRKLDAKLESTVKKMRKAGVYDTLLLTIKCTEGTHKKIIESEKGGQQ